MGAVDESERGRANRDKENRGTGSFWSDVLLPAAGVPVAAIQPALDVVSRDPAGAAGYLAGEIAPLPPAGKKFVGKLARNAYSFFDGFAEAFTTEIVLEIESLGTAAELNAVMDAMRRDPWKHINVIGHFQRGILSGLTDEIRAIANLYHIVTDFQQLANDLGEMMLTLMATEDTAVLTELGRESGKQLGIEFRGKMGEVFRQGPSEWAFQLGKLVGPQLAHIVLSILFPPSMGVTIPLKLIRLSERLRGRTSGAGKQVLEKVKRNVRTRTPDARGTSAGSKGVSNNGVPPDATPGSSAPRGGDSGGGSGAPIPSPVHGGVRKITAGLLAWWERKGGHAVLRHHPDVVSRKMLKTRVVGEHIKEPPPTFAEELFSVWQGDRTAKASRWVDDQTMREMIEKAINENFDKIKSLRFGETLPVNYRSRRKVGEGYIRFDVPSPGGKKKGKGKTQGEGVFFVEDIRGMTIVFKRMESPKFTPNAGDIDTWYVLTAFPEVAKKEWKLID